MKLKRRPGLGDSSGIREQLIRVRKCGLPPRGSLPFASAIPANTSIFVLDIKDSSLSIPLREPDCKCFTFSIPKVSSSGPADSYEWRVLPQGMTATPPPIYQEAVAHTLKCLIKSGLCVYHYTDDLLMWQDKQQDQKLALEHLKQQAIRALKEKGFRVAEDKSLSPLSRSDSNYLTSVWPAEPVIDFPNPLTLNIRQSFLGNVNWLRPWFPIPTSQLQPLFDLLKGYKKPFSPLSLTPASKEALCHINNYI